jgi:hypothetical protein
VAGLGDRASGSKRLIVERPTLVRVAKSLTLQVRAAPPIRHCAGAIVRPIYSPVTVHAISRPDRSQLRHLNGAKRPGATSPTSRWRRHLTQKEPTGSARPKLSHYRPIMIVDRKAVSIVVVAIRLPLAAQRVLVSSRSIMRI